MSTEAANQVEGWGGLSVLGAMSPVERRAGRFLRGPDGDDGAAHQPAAPEPAAPEPGAPEPAPVAAEPAPPAPAPADPVAAKPIRPEGLPDQFWDDATGLKLGDLAAFVREAVEARADVPTDAAGYELKISDAIKIPDGFAVELNADDPLFKEITAAALAAGTPKAKFQGFIDAYARAQIANQQKFVADFAAERGKLGDNGKARIEAVTNWATASFPKDQAEALQDLTDTAAGVQVLEAIIKLRAGPTSPGAGDVTNGAGKKSRAQIMYPET